MANTVTWVVYQRSHPAQFYYIGKSSRDRINAGYIGSGVRLRCVYLQPGFEPETWQTTILSEHAEEHQAFTAEGALVPLERLADPYCLNDTPGGRSRHRGSAHAALLKKQVKKRTIGVKTSKKLIKPLTWTVQ